VEVCALSEAEAIHQTRVPRVVDSAFVFFL
jgi:hypothetical protein